MPPLQNIAGYLLIGLSVLMLLKSLTLCAGNDIWYDELFTVGLAGHSFGELVMYTARDVHPPLYYCIVRIFTELCKLIAPALDAAVTAKFVSVLPYFILLVYSLTLIRRRFGILTGGLFLFCTVSMPQLSAYTVEARMYSWALLFVTAAFLHAYEAVCAVSVEEAAAAEKTAGSGEGGGLRAADLSCRHGEASLRRHGAAFVLCGLAAAYTQYFACVAVVMIYLWLLCFFLWRDRRGIRRWFCWVSLSVLGYAPWLAALFGQLAAVHENYWILPVSWRTFGGCVKFIMKPAFADERLNVVLAVALFLVYTAAICVSVLKLYHSGRVYEAGFVCAGVGVPVGLALFGIIASVLFRPVFVYRYMIPALGCFWLAFAAAAGALAERVLPAKGGAACGGGLGQETDDAAGQENGVGPETVGRRAVQIPGMVVAAACALILCVGLRDYRAFMGEEEYKALQMEKTQEALAAIGPEDILIFNFDQVQMVLGYYVNNESYLWYGQPEPLIQEICGQKQSLNEDTGQIREWLAAGRKVWFAGSFNSRDDIVSLWESQGIRVSGPTDCLLERYWFNLYELSAD